MPNYLGIVNPPMLLDTRQPKIHEFVMVTDYGKILNSTVAGTPTLGVLAFKLSDMLNYSAFTSIFDQYLIKRITVKFESLAQVVAANDTVAAATITAPRFYTAIDYYDSTVPAAPQNVIARTGVTTTRVTRSFSRSFQPLSLAMIYEGVGTGYNPSPRWIDCADPSVPHYGLKYCLEASSVATPLNIYGYSVTVEAELCFMGNHYSGGP